MDAPPSPNHIIDFLANEPALELEDPIMEVEEDPKEDTEIDIGKDEEDEWEEDDDWLMVPVIPPRAADFPANEPALKLEDPIMEVEEDPMEDPEEYSDIDIDENEEDDTYEVGGLSSAVPKAPYPVGRHLLVVAARVALHHEEIGALCVRADKIEYMQTSLVRKVDGVSDTQVADSIAIGELQPRITTVEE
nr:hypothetical protein [Tanacetum cinerariifolium]